MHASLHKTIQYAAVPALFLLCLFVATNVRAAVVVAEAPVGIGIGDTFAVPVVLDSEGESINAIEGTLSYPWNILTLREIRDGNTVVSLWVERPEEQKVGAIRFAGIIPGGYQGNGGEIVTLVFEARDVGSVALKFNEGRAYPNDGTGESSEASLRSEVFAIQKLGSGARVASLSDTDTEAPEIFIPVVSSSPDLFEGQNFVVFATQDKASGIDHYEIAERRGFRFPLFQTLKWQSAPSPFVLSDQSGGSYVYVKAVDRAGNTRIARLSPANAPFYFSDVALVAILLVLVGVIFFYVRKRGNQQT